MPGTNITDHGISALIRIPELSELDVRNCRGVTRAGLEQMVGKASLRTLKVGGSAIDDAALGVVAKIGQLHTLSVDNCPVTDAGVSQLGSLPLIDLTIYQCTNVSDEGLDRICLGSPTCRASRSVRQPSPTRPWTRCPR